MTTWALEVRCLSHRYGATPVLAQVDLRVAAGERLALIGPNGAGKTTLFNAIAGGLQPNAGEICLHGHPLNGLPVHRRHHLGLGRSFQISQLFPRLTVRDHLSCAASWVDGQGYRFWRLLARQHRLRAQVDHWLERLALSHRAEVPAQSLSYAEQRTLDIGMALASGADVLLLDEPTAGMSRSETARFVPLLREVTAGKTLLLVEHDMGVVFDLADRVAVLAQGRVLACDTPDAVRADPLVRQAYLGAIPTAQTQGNDDGVRR